MFDTEVQYGEGIDGVADFFEKSGRLRADYIIEQTGGNAKVLHVAFEGVAIGDYLSKGFEEELAEKCPDCEIVNTVSITPADIAQMRQKFETGLLQATDANAIVVDLGFMLAGGIQQSIVSNNAADGRVVLGGECTQDEIGYIRDGDGIQACIAISNGRAAWSLADQLNRFFSGQEAVKDGIGWTLLDAESPNLPPAGENYDGPLDYRSGYAELWGLS
jgi:ribose transport system substrate-binding protein